jgi:hypothetical protein
MADMAVSQQNEAGQQVRIHRPFSLTLFTVLLICLGGLGLYRSGWYLIIRDLVWSIASPFRFWYLLNSGLPAGILCPAIGVWIWRGDPLGRLACLWAVAGLTAQYWIEKLLIGINSTARVDWPFALILNAFLAGAVAAILYSPDAQRYFQKEQS